MNHQRKLTWKTIFPRGIYTDILHLYHHTDYLTAISLQIREQISPASIIKKTRNVLRIFLRDAYVFLFCSEAKLNKDLVIFVSAKNNADAVKFLFDDNRFQVFKFGQKRIGTLQLETFHFKHKIFYNILFPLFLFRYLRKNKHNNAMKYWDYSIRAVGLFEEAYRWIRRYKPSFIIMSNDHCVEQRSMLNAAIALDVPCIYIQHASVSEYFPPLRFSLSILEGEDSLRKYEKAGIVKGKVELIGMARFAPYANCRKPARVSPPKSIAVCFNVYDSLLDLKRVADEIATSFAAEIVLRPHPGDTRDLTLLKTYDLSDSKVQDTFKFLSGIDCVIAGDSSIHLEATMLNIPSIYFQFTQRQNRDYYGFIKNRLIPDTRTLSELIELLSDPDYLSQNHFERAKFYNSAIGEDYEANVDQKIKLALESFMINEVT